MPFLLVKDWNPMPVEYVSTRQYGTWSFTKGVAAGFYDSGVAIVDGAVMLVKLGGHVTWSYNPIAVSYRLAMEGRVLTVEDRQKVEVGLQVAQVIGEIAQKILTQPAIDLVGIAIGDDAALNAVGEDYRKVFQTLVEVLVEAKEAFAGMDDYEGGRLIGRLVGEVLSQVASTGAVNATRAGLAMNLAEKVKGIPAIAKFPKVVAAIEKAALAMTKAAGGAEDLAQTERLVSKGLSENVSRAEKLKKTLQATAPAAAKVENKLAAYLREAMVGIFKEAKGDYRKVPSAKELYEMLGYVKEPVYPGSSNVIWKNGLARANGMSVHHTGGQAAAKWLLEKKGVQVTTDLLDDMPGLAINETHNPAAGPLHDVLTRRMTEILNEVKSQGDNVNITDFFEDMKNAYMQWDPEIGADVWAATRSWFESKGVRP